MKGYADERPFISRSHCSFVFPSLVEQNLFPLNWVWPSELIGWWHLEHEYSFLGFFSLAFSQFASCVLLLHSVVLEILFGCNDSSICSGTSYTATATTSSSDNGDVNVGAKCKRRLTLAWPVVSIVSSKVAGLTDGIECTGRSFASGNADCEHKLASGRSVPWSKSFTSSTRVLFLNLKIQERHVKSKTIY
jgi:hypothetical protein